MTLILQEFDMNMDDDVVCRYDIIIFINFFCVFVETRTRTSPSYSICFGLLVPSVRSRQFVPTTSA